MNIFSRMEKQVCLKCRCDIDPVDNVCYQCISSDVLLENLCLVCQKSCDYDVCDLCIINIESNFCVECGEGIKLYDKLCIKCHMKDNFCHKCKQYTRSNNMCTFCEQKCQKCNQVIPKDQSCKRCINQFGRCGKCHTFSFDLYQKICTTCEKKCLKCPLFTTNENDYCLSCFIKIKESWVEKTGALGFVTNEISKNNNNLAYIEPMTKQTIQKLIENYYRVKDLSNENYHTSRLYNRELYDLQLYPKTLKEKFFHFLLFTNRMKQFGKILPKFIMLKIISYI